MLGLGGEKKVDLPIYVIRERECLACSVPDLLLSKGLRVITPCFSCYSSSLYTYTCFVFLTILTLPCLALSRLVLLSLQEEYKEQ